MATKQPKQLSEEEFQEREDLRKLLGYGRPEDLSDFSEMTFGFDVFERFPNGKDRMNFVVSDEAAELRALVRVKGEKEAQERRDRMTDEERRIDALQTELLFLQLAQIDRESKQMGV